MRSLVEMEEIVVYAVICRVWMLLTLNGKHFVNPLCILKFDSLRIRRWDSAVNSTSFVDGWNEKIPRPFVRPGSQEDCRCDWIWVLRLYEMGILRVNHLITY